MIDTKGLTIEKAHEHLTKGDFSARELADAHLESIAEKNPRINAYLEVFADDARAQADAADMRFKEGTATTLTGIPLAIKDNILIKGKVASCASKMLANYKAAYDATAIAKLKKEGAVFLGRANMDEFAMGSSNENSAFGPVHNPVDETRAPGGSSGGPAAAVAMDGAIAALGSDTGGSIRQPASFCGLVGFKPTYGAVSRHGLVAMASSLDQIGPLAKNVADARILHEAITGHDPMDSTTWPDATRTVPPVQGYVKKVIGVPFHLFNMEGIEKEATDNFTAALDVYKKLGYTVKEIKLPYVKYSLAAYYIIMPAEVSTNLARFDGVRYGLHRDGDNMLEDYFLSRGEGFGQEPRRRIILGTYVLSAGYYDAYYNRARAVRRLIEKDFERAFEEVEVIMMPTSPSPAFKLGEKTSDPLAMYLSDIFTVPVNIAGIPGISIPAGTVMRDGKALPMGLQIIGPNWSENRLFDYATAFEAAQK